MSAAHLQSEIVAALEDVGGRRDGGSFAVVLDAFAQRRLRCEAQMIRNRAQMARNTGTVDLNTTQVVDVRGWVLRIRSDIRSTKSVAHIA